MEGRLWQSRQDSLTNRSLQFMDDTQASPLFQYVELFLDEVESRGRELDAAECEQLAEMLVRLVTGDHDCRDVMWRLERLLATDIPMPGRRRRKEADADLPTIAEYRALLEEVRRGG